MPRPHQTPLRLTLLAAPLATLLGCGGPYDASVSGDVTLDGQPLTRGTVSFTPTAGGPPAYARIDGSGSYAVRTGREVGLPAGEYSVTVVANEPPAAAQGEDGGPPPAGKPITPPWYRSAETSGLRFQVEPGSNDIDLPLTTQAPAGWDPRGGRR